MSRILQSLQVNIPFTMLYESYLPRFIQNKINPEIGFDAIALDRFSMSDYKNIAKQLHQKGRSITLHAPFMDLSPCSPDLAVRKLTRHRFRQLAELIPVFQPVTVVCHSGWDNKRYSYIKDAWVQAGVEFWSWFAEDIGKKGALLMMENVYEYGPDEFMYLFQKLKNNGVGFCLDTGHQAAFGRADLSEWLKILGADIGQLHLHDNHGEQDDHLALGKGGIDFRVLFRYFKKMKADPPVITLEPHDEKDLCPSIKYLEDVWPW